MRLFILCCLLMYPTIQEETWNITELYGTEVPILFPEYQYEWRDNRGFK